MADATKEFLLKAMKERSLHAACVGRETVFVGRIVTDADRDALGSVDGHLPRPVIDDGHEVYACDFVRVDGTPTGWTIANDPPDMVGGYPTEGFIVTVATTEEVVQIATEYYFGRPRVLDGWTIPIHRHPDWDWNAIVQAYASRRLVSREEWIQRSHEERELMDRMVDEWRATGKRGGNLWDLRPYLFHTVELEPPAASVLELRCDCREIVIVREETANRRGEPFEPGGPDDGSPVGLPRPDVGCEWTEGLRPERDGRGVCGYAPSCRPTRSRPTRSRRAARASLSTLLLLLVSGPLAFSVPDPQLCVRFFQERPVKRA